MVYIKVVCMYLVFADSECGIFLCYSVGPATGQLD
jgi:hypothetical protein